MPADAEQGSSPRMRGALAFCPRLEAYLRIIPADAGSTLNPFFLQNAT